MQGRNSAENPLTFEQPSWKPIPFPVQIQGPKKTGSDCALVFRDSQVKTLEEFYTKYNYIATQKDFLVVPVKQLKKKQPLL